MGFKNKDASTLATGCHFKAKDGRQYNEERVIALAKHYGWQAPGNPDTKEHFHSPQELHNLDAKEAEKFMEDFAPKGYRTGWEGDAWGVYKAE